MKVSVIIVFTFWLNALSTFSQIVSFDFSGIVTSKDDPTNFLETGFTAGSIFTGNVTFDTAAASTDFYPDDPLLGLYAISTTFNLTMYANGHTILGTYGLITVEPVTNELGSSHLNYSSTIKSYDGTNVPAEFTAFGYGLAFTRNNSPFSLTNDVLPMLSPNLSDADVSTIAIYAQNGITGMEFFVYGDITQISPVPEPSTVGLVAIGAVILMCSRKQHRD